MGEQHQPLNTAFPWVDPTCREGPRCQREALVGARWGADSMECAWPPQASLQQVLEGLPRTRTSAHYLLGDGTPPVSGACPPLSCGTRVPTGVRPGSCAGMHPPSPAAALGSADKAQASGVSQAAPPLPPARSTSCLFFPDAPARPRRRESPPGVSVHTRTGWGWDRAGST